jgi:hypothetical protein
MQERVHEQGISLILEENTRNFPQKQLKIANKTLQKRLGSLQDLF